MIVISFLFLSSNRLLSSSWRRTLLWSSPATGSPCLCTALQPRVTVAPRCLWRWVLSLLHTKLTFNKAQHNHPAVSSGCPWGCDWKVYLCARWHHPRSLDQRHQGQDHGRHQGMGYWPWYPALSGSGHLWQPTEAWGDETRGRNQVCWLWGEISLFHRKEFKQFDGTV